MKQTTNKKVYKSDFPKTLLIVAIHGHSIYILYIRFPQPCEFREFTWAGESLPKASAALRRRLVEALKAPVPDPFVQSMHPPDSLPLRLVAGSVSSEPSEDAKELLKGTSILNHTLSLRSKLLKAVKPELELAKDKQATWEACVWAQAVIMSRAFHVPKDSDRLLLIPIVPWNYWNFVGICFVLGSL